MAVRAPGGVVGIGELDPTIPVALEVGFACDDPALVREAADFVADVIAFSEQVDTTCVGPEPNLVPAEFDDAAMAEAAYEQHLAYLERMDEDEEG